MKFNFLWCRQFRLGNAVLIGLSCLLLSGCQGGQTANPVPASGVVMYNGEPLAGAYVVFVPEEGPKATATTDADGSFELMTVKEKDGVVPGPCRIAVEKRAPLDPKDPYVAPKSLIPERYSSIKDSGLSETVNADGENFFTIDLKK